MANTRKFRPSPQAPVDMRIEDDNMGLGLVFSVCDPATRGEWIKVTVEQALEAGWIEEIPEEKFCPMCHIDNGHLPECKIGRYEKIEALVVASKLGNALVIDEDVAEFYVSVSEIVLGDGS